MRNLLMMEDFNPLNTKPQAVAPANPKIDPTPDLDDECVEICWKSPAYLGEWCLSGPKRSRDAAQSIVREMKSAEIGSDPEVEHLLPLDAFIATYAQKLNPHGWTLDFTPEDLDWSTTPGHPVHEAASSKKLPPMPKFLKDAGAREEFVQFGGPRQQGQQEPNCWDVMFTPPTEMGRTMIIHFFPEGYFQFATPGKVFSNNRFSGKWQASTSAEDKFNFGKLSLNGVKMQFTTIFGQSTYQ